MPPPTQGYRKRPLERAPILHSWRYSVFDLAEKPKDAVRLTLSDQIERDGLQNLIGPDQPDHAPLAEDLMHPCHDSGDLRHKSLERLELLDLSLEMGDLLVNGVIEAGLKA